MGSSVYFEGGRLAGKKLILRIIPTSEICVRGVDMEV